MSTDLRSATSLWPVERSVESYSRTAPDTVAVRQKRMGIWQEHTWSELNAQVDATAAGLRRLGVASGDPVVLMTEPTVDALVVDLAVQRIGAALLPVHPATPGAGLAGVARMGPSVVVCESSEHAEALVSGGAKLRTAIITGIGARSVRDDFDTLSLRELREESGAPTATSDVSGPAAALAQIGLADVQPLDDAATRALFESAPELVSLREGDRVFPVQWLADPVERVLGVYAALAAKAVVHFSETPASVGTDLEEVAPTVLIGGRRFYESIQLDSVTRGEATGRIRRKLYGWGMATKPTSSPVRRLVARLLIVSHVATRHGLQRVRRAVALGESGLSQATVDFFTTLGVEISGLTVTPLWRPGAPTVDVSESAATWRASGTRLVERELMESLYVRRAVVESGADGLETVIELEIDTVSRWASGLAGVEFTTPQSLTAHPRVHELVLAHVADVNGLLGADLQLRGVRLVPGRLSIMSGELSPDLLPNREQVSQAYGSGSGRPMLTVPGRAS